MKRKRKIPILAFAAVFMLLSSDAAAYDLKEITPDASSILFRQKSREDVLRQFKAAGLAGENASGYLEVRGEPQTTKTMIDEENADRKQLYGIIAEQNRLGSAGLGSVESAAAAKIRENAAKGTYVQLSTGRWVRK